MLYTRPMPTRDFLLPEAAEYCNLNVETFRHYMRPKVGKIVPDGKIGRNNTFSKKSLDVFKRWYAKNGRPRLSTGQRAAEAYRLFQEKLSSSQVAQKLGFKTPEGAWKAAQRHQARLAKSKS